MKKRRNHLIGFLTTELDGVENVKKFSSLLKKLNLCDLTVDKELEKVTENGGAALQVLITWFTLGLLDKLVEVQKLIKD